MKNLIRIGSGWLFLLASCSSSTLHKKETAPLSFIEKFLQNGATLTDIKNTFGEPHNIIKTKQVAEVVYDYDDKENQGNKWDFGVNKNGELVWLYYRPWGNPLLNRVEVLPSTLKKYNCERKRERDTRVPHVIRDFTFFECAEGRIRAHYNIHGEINTIAVNR